MEYQKKKKKEEEKKIDHYSRVTGSNHHKACTGFHFVVISQESLKLVHTIGASWSWRDIQSRKI